jgi:hypothetical protein
VLKTGIRLFGTDVPEKDLPTCCALHKCLLETDGLDQKWEDAVDCDWIAEPDRKGDDDDNSVFDDDEWGGDDNSGKNENGIVTNRNSDKESSEKNEHQGHSADKNEEDNKEFNDDTNVLSTGPVHVVRNLSFKEFRRRLIVHFAIAWSQKEVKRPSRLGNMNKTPVSGVVD